MNNIALVKIITERIANSPNRRITFAEYMDLVLYHPQQGYYTTRAVDLGVKGDFFTSVHLGVDLGELLAEQFVQMWEILGKPKPFTIVEMGAGQGFLAKDIFSYLDKNYLEFLDSLDYIIVEKSLSLITQQRERLQKWEQVSWRSLEEIPNNSTIGCWFSNELVDAFPVHQVIKKEGKLKEIYVTYKDEFIEVTNEFSTNKIEKYFDLVGIDLLSDNYPDGYRTEVNLAALDWLEAVADSLKKGFVLTIDYGYPATRYYSPMRKMGTLKCYYRHQHHDDPYSYIGHQDITAHVDFTALKRQGEQCGLELVGFTQQGLFLMGLGLGDRLANLSQERDIQKIFQRRDALHQLIDPTGLGGFGVLIQSKGLTEVEKKRSLKGLTTP